MIDDWYRWSIDWWLIDDWLIDWLIDSFVNWWMDTRSLIPFMRGIDSFYQIISVALVGCRVVSCRVVSSLKQFHSSPIINQLVTSYRANVKCHIISFCFSRHGGPIQSVSSLSAPLYFTLLARVNTIQYCITYMKFRIASLVYSLVSSSLVS